VPGFCFATHPVYIAATENEKNETEDVKEVDTESEVNIEKSDKDAEEVETESVDS